MTPLIEEDHDSDLVWWRAERDRHSGDDGEGPRCAFHTPCPHWFIPPPHPPCALFVSLLTARHYNLCPMTKVVEGPLAVLRMLHVSPHPAGLPELAAPA